MPKTINVELSVNGIRKALSELRDYRQSIEDKNAIFVQRLAETGLPVIESAMSSINGDANPEHYSYIKVDNLIGYCRATIHLSGTDIAFIEFGSGIHYNGSVGTSPNPKGQELGLTIGSYGYGLGKNNSWSYETESGEWVRTHGVQAAMPMYKASLEIMQKVQEIAKEVFA